MNVTTNNKEYIPKVSIGMPVYNGEKYIRKAIDSLLAQTHSNFELIISDNASIDQTEMICLEYAQNNSRIRYVRQRENRGATANFQFVLNEAVGEYFMWAADDDQWAPTFISECVSVFLSNSDCVSVFCHFNVVDLTTNVITERITPTPCSSASPFRRVSTRFFEMIPSMIYGLHRTEVIRRIKFENYDYVDVFITAVLSFYGKVLISPQYLFTNGTYGKRRPYSTTGKYLCFNLFRLRVAEFLKNNFSLKKRIFLLLTIYYKSYKAEKYFKRIIDNWPSQNK